MSRSTVAVDASEPTRVGLTSPGTRSSRPGPAGCPWGSCHRTGSPPAPGASSPAAGPASTGSFCFWLRVRGHGPGGSFRKLAVLLFRWSWVSERRFPVTPCQHVRLLLSEVSVLQCAAFRKRADLLAAVAQQEAGPSPATRQLAGFTPHCSTPTEKQHRRAIKPETSTKTQEITTYGAPKVPLIIVSLCLHLAPNWIVTSLTKYLLTNYIFSLLIK